LDHARDPRPEAGSGVSDRDGGRAGFLDELRESLAADRAALSSALAGDPYDAPRVIRSWSESTDRLIRRILDFVITRLYPGGHATGGEKLSVLAVGGYGRGELAPYSDIDLLFLIPWKQTAWGEQVVEAVLYLLWDLKLKVGHSVRTADDCLRLAREDVTIRTALLEHRFFWGDATQARDLEERLWSELFRGTGPEFVELKLLERAARHDKQGGSRYVVEPNVKEGKGGLRDLQTLYWIAKYLHRARANEELVGLGVFDSREFGIFRKAEDFLWTVRCQLHLLAGRASEQLSFDTQSEVARALGFRDGEGRRAVEHFMQAYFLHARNVGELTRIFLVALEEQHVKKRPKLRQSILNMFGFGRDSTAQGYRLTNGRLDVAKPADFVADPVNFLRIFEEAVRTDLQIHPAAMRLITANLNKIDETVQQDPAANRIFLDMLLSRNNPDRTLRNMNELGVLGAFIPEFGRIVAMMQFNMYHSFTVDEHIIQCISQFSKIERGELKEDLPVASEILARGVNRAVILVALLLHDIGKGLPEDHSEIGAEIAGRICPRLGLEPHEAETVVWLVRNHLLMSDTAQKRDIADPRTIRNFAKAVENPLRLRLLTVLTVCDIRGVGPDVWNNWKAVLLRSLYQQALDVMSDGAGQSQKERIDHARAELRRVLPDWSAQALDAECARHYGPYWLGLDTPTHRVFAGLLQEVRPDEVNTSLDPDESRDATRACFVMQDHPGIFARFAGALALSGANVVDARTYTSSDGLATAVFWIQDAEGRPYEKSRLTRLRKTVTQMLKGEVIAREALKSRDRVKRREKDFVVPTTITFDNTASDIHTLIEVDTRDRPGLLHDLARTLTANNISIASAVIATYGEQAVDAFYVKDLFGLKLHSESKQKQLEARLKEAIRRGAESAAG
jgi:[protein-PII] uridylyltransferase